VSWLVLAGCSAGAGHDRAAVSSQDAHAVTEVDDTLVVAVADGAGSAPFAGVGAALAVRLAQQEMGRLLRAKGELPALVRTGARRTLRRFHRSVAALAHGAGLHPRDFATTLTVVLARPPWVAAFAVGDGFVVTRARDELTLLLAPPGGADRPPGAATLLPLRFGNVRAERRMTRVDGLTGLAVGTDGLESLMIEFAGARPVRPAAKPFHRLFALADDPETDPSALNRILAGRPVGDLSSDDRTLVLAVPR
jgi:Protein phosphatase 2C